MITLADIKSSINHILDEKIGYKVYGREISQGFTRPCFFVELLPTGSDSETQNFSSNKLTVIITYFQKMSQCTGYSDLENIKMYDSLKNLFAMNLPVKTRILHPQNARVAYTGENIDILQFSFDLDYFDTTGRTRNTEELAESITINIKEAK